MGGCQLSDLRVLAVREPSMTGGSKRTSVCTKVPWPEPNVVST